MVLFLELPAEHEKIMGIIRKVNTATPVPLKKPALTTIH